MYPVCTLAREEGPGVRELSGQTHTFTGQPVALRVVGDGIWDVYYCHQKIGQVDLTC